MTQSQACTHARSGKAIEKHEVPDRPRMFEMGTVLMRIKSARPDFAAKTRHATPT